MISKSIKKLRQQMGLTQNELAKRVSVSPSTIAMYERGDREPNSDVVVRLTDVFGVEVNEIYGKPPKKIKIPVLGYVAAGIPIEAVEEVLDYEELSPQMVRDGAEYFALKIKGHSMEPKISEGDVVIVRKQEDCDSGQIVIVCVNGDRATCKKLIKKANGILLQPLNPAYESAFYTEDDVKEIPITIIGRVIELRAKF